VVHEQTHSLDQQDLELAGKQRSTKASWRAGDPLVGKTCACVRGWFDPEMSWEVAPSGRCGREQA